MKRKSIRQNDRRKWKQNKSSIRRRFGKSSPFSKTGRYLIAVIVGIAVLHAAGKPVLERIKSHPVFTVRKVVVKGTGYIDREEIIEKAAVQMGVNIFEVDIAGISKTLKEAFIAEDFTVFRRFPDTITIRVQEKKPVALLNMKTLVGVDAEGVPLPHVGEACVETLPIISGITSVSTLSDSTVKARLVTGLRLLDRISDDAPTVYKRISEVDVSSVKDLGITLIDNRLEVIIGADDWEQKIPNLDKVISKVTERMEAVSSIDIRFGEKIFVRKK